MGGGQNGSGGWGGNSTWGAPGYQPGYQPGTTEIGPDWAALAEANATEARRKRLIRVGIGVLSALAVAGIVVVAVAVQGPGGKKPSADRLSAASVPAGAGSTAPSATPSAAASASPSTVPSTAPPTGNSDVRLGTATQVGSVDGHSGPALTLHAASEGYAEVNSTVIDTSTSFTVSAMVDNSATAEPKAAVSQGSDKFFSLYLGRDDSSSATHNKWVFKVQTAAATGKSIMALSTGPATTGRWTTLTGVYDAKARTIALYVDGALAQTTPAPGILSTTGPIEIGRARYKSHWADLWDGSIADVQVWAQPLPPDKVAQLATTRSTDIPARATWFRF
ncbi:LamG domain-containing protein [Kitasatospora sp. MAP5-34]|uniref:LamG domain-containing protein n=1 Tax=Kitasatospora sp. MAP5-34 TaxID=3035102 RepID=UPI0024748B53|nr:LamG domain-containing protein [Kitasatospora sp. MAP5-34]MDH6578721.1 hypothetical protein [Kitasatospora sp. MAP5-34]